MTGPVGSPQLTPFPVLTGLGHRPRIGWQWMAGNWRNGPELELTHASSRRLTVRLDDPSEVTFTILGRSTQAPLIDELVSDVWVYRRGRALFRGRVMNSDDTFDETNHTTSFTAKDYREVLNHRLLPAGSPGTTTSYTPVPTKAQEAIVWDNLIAVTQGRPGGNLGITKGNWPATGVNRSDILFEDGDSIFELIRTLSKADNGFDFDIDPQLRANLYYPSRGVDKGSVLDYGGTVSKGRRTVSADQYANSLRANGGTTTDGSGGFVVNGSAGDLNDIAQYPEGLWEAAIAETNVYDQSLLQSIADAELAKRSVIQPGYQFTMTVGSWNGPDHLWVGDYLTYTVRTGRLDIRNEVGQVKELQIDVDANDVETVQVVIGQPANTLTRTLREFGRRLADLDKH